MQAVWSGRLTRAATKYGEVAPNAAVCCNACRTCVSTNLVGLALAGIAGLGSVLPRFVRRFGKPS